MGIQVQMARFILHEHRYRPLTGSLLLIGRQTVYMTPDEAVQVIREEGVPVRKNVNIELDATTRTGASSGNISDKSFFALFTDARLEAIDVSDYEGAELIHDLNEPIPDRLRGKYDFIYNGSCLDNIFDPATTLKNLSRLLGPGGRMIDIEHGSQVNGPYLMYPVDWFYDYFLINHYADCKVYVAHYESLETPWDAYLWEPLKGSNGVVTPDWSVRYPQRRDCMILTVVEKGPDSTDDRTPIQAQYRSPAGERECSEQARRFAASPRPKLGGNPTAPSTPYFILRDQALKRTGLKLRLRRWLGAPDAIVAPAPGNFTFCRTLSPPVSSATH
jgi:SAM-dependent methyltransferase